MTGCIDTPKSTVENVYDAIKHGNMQKLVRNSTESGASIYSLEALKNCTLNKTTYADDLNLVQDCLKERYKNITIKTIKIKKVSDGEAYANVIIEDEKTIKKYFLKLLNIEDSWKVVGRKDLVSN